MKSLRNVLIGSLAAKKYENKFQKASRDNVSKIDGLAWTVPISLI